MREIKFRAWDNILNEYFSWEDSIKFNNYHDLIEDNYDGAVSLEQYTCLKDINGVAIYEGDVLKDFDENIIVGFVEYDEAYGEYICGDDSLYEAIRDCVVIGNIHKNQELLEEQL